MPSITPARNLRESGPSATGGLSRRKVGRRHQANRPGFRATGTSFSDYLRGLTLPPPAPCDESPSAAIHVEKAESDRCLPRIPRLGGDLQPRGFAESCQIPRNRRKLYSFRVLADGLLSLAASDRIFQDVIPKIMSRIPRKSEGQFPSKGNCLHALHGEMLS